MSGAHGPGAIKPEAGPRIEALVQVRRRVNQDELDRGPHGRLEQLAAMRACFAFRQERVSMDVRFVLFPGHGPGWTAQKGSRQRLGAPLVGYFQDGKFRHPGYGLRRAKKAREVVRERPS